MRTVGSIEVEQRVKGIKGTILTKKRNKLQDPKGVALMWASKNLRHIMKAKKKPLDIKTADDFGVNIEPRLLIVKVEEPEARAAGVKVADVQELVNKLKNEAKVI